MESKDHSDVVFQLDTKTFHAHRFILCSASEVFRRLFDVEALGAKKIKVDSLAECPGWSSRRLKKVTVENVRNGLVEGLLSVEEK